MNARRDDGEVSARLLADAAARACTFEFSAAEALCKRILALERHGPGTRRHTPQVQALLKAIEHNRSSYLYNLTVKASLSAVNGSAAPAFPTVRFLCRRLFASAMDVRWRACRSGDVKCAGTFDVHFDKTGMVVSGSVFDTSQTVHVFINELLVASAPVAPDERSFRRAGSFLFRIDTRSLSLFPGDSKTRLAVSTGNAMLRHIGGSASYLTDWPDGKGGIEDAIWNGAMLTGHHRIKKPPAPAIIERWLNTYEKLAAHTNEVWSKPLFLYYGSLLGAVRDNRIIPYDDDFDVAYFSDKTSAVAVKEEMISIIATLAASETGMVIRLMNFFFKIRIEKCVIDVFPTWHDGDVLWSPWSTRLQCEGDLLKHLVEREFYGHRVLVPAKAERFLELKYGEGWRIPDPTYRVQALPSLAYPFRRIPFGEDDRTRIISAAREIAGNSAIATVKLMGE